MDEAYTPLPEQVADAIPALISYIDAGRRYRYVNRAYQAWFEQDAASIVGRPMAEILGEAAYAAVRPRVEAALRGEAQRFEADLAYRTGARRVDIRYVPDQGPDGIRGFYALVVDRTDPLAQSRRLGETLDSFGEAFVAFDPSWSIVHYNAVAAAHLPPEAGSLLGRNVWDVWPDAPGTALHQVLMQAMESRRPAEGEGPSLMQAGRWLFVRAFPLDIGLGVSFRDVTERRERLRQEREKAERLAGLESRRAFLLTAADALRSLDDPDVIIATAARLLGERLKAARLGYADVDREMRVMTVRREYAAPGVVSLEGRRFPLEGVGSELAKLLRDNRGVYVADVELDPRTASQAADYAHIQTRATLAVPLIRNGRLEAIIYAHHPEPDAWTDDEVALAEDVAARTWSALMRAVTARDLRESEARFRAMADAAPSPVWLTDADGAMEYVNAVFAERAGRAPEDLLGNGWLAHVHPEDLAAAGKARDEARLTLGSFTYEARFLHTGGEYRWLRVSSGPRFDGDGVFRGYVGLAMDVTETRIAEERQRLLINELNHRVKNTLATVQSLARQTLREDLVTTDARERLTDRLMALSAAHNILTRESWEGAELAQIVAEAVRPYQDETQTRLLVSGPRARLQPNAALAISMALHELATNAVKYGALSVPEGRVRIEWRNAEPEVLELVWREVDGPPVTPPSRTGFGSRLLQQGLAAELGRAAEVAYEPDGLTARLRAPVTRA